PPSKTSPSKNPSKSITTVSLSSTAPSSLMINSACCSLNCSNVSSTSSSVTSVDCSSTSRFLYSPSSTSGFTVTVAVNTSGFPCSISPTSIDGWSTGSIPVSSIALLYASGKTKSIASWYNDSTPKRLSNNLRGIFPFLNPGTCTVFFTLSKALSKPLSKSSADTSNVSTPSLPSCFSHFADIKSPPKSINSIHKLS